jgi:hypothetical protein
VILAGVLLAAGLGYYAAQKLHHGLGADWRVSGWLAVGLLLLGLGLQLGELLGMLPFYPGSSGYASTFNGWAVMNSAFILATAYWLETLLAREARLRHQIAEDGGIERSRLPAVRLFHANVDSFVFFLGFVGLVELVFWVLFYVV